MQEKQGTEILLKFLENRTVYKRNKGRITTSKNVSGVHFVSRLIQYPLLKLLKDMKGDW